MYCQSWKMELWQAAHISGTLCGCKKKGPNSSRKLILDLGKGHPSSKIFVDDITVMTESVACTR